MADDPLLERALRCEGLPTIVGLLLLCVLAWAYLASGARMGASAWETTTLALFPHRHAAEVEASMAGMAMPGVGGAATWLLLVAMWFAMMLAMMAPSAVPMLLLYARVHAHFRAGESGMDGVHAPVGAFAFGYLAVWGLFSLAAASLQLWLQQRGLLSATTMGLPGRWATGGLLLAAGLYQLTPLKGACLAQCRSPAAFLSRYWRPGRAGAFYLGLVHGGYCVGCCWLLMALLFVGGVMNLVWIALLSILVGVEKIAGRGRAAGKIAGALLVAWGLATFLS
jgi:predicted metal-binding membrane protein